MGLQTVNCFCILVMWENKHTDHNYSNEYGFGFANGQPISYIEDIS